MQVGQIITGTYGTTGVRKQSKLEERKTIKPRERQTSKGKWKP